MKELKIKSSSSSTFEREVEIKSATPTPPPPKPPRLSVSKENTLKTGRETSTTTTTTTKAENATKPTMEIAKTQNATMQQQQHQQQQQEQQQKPKKHLHFQSPLEVRRLSRQLSSLSAANENVQQQKKEERARESSNSNGNDSNSNNITKYATILLSSQTTCNKNNNNCNNNNNDMHVTTAKIKTTKSTTFAMKSTSLSLQQEQHQENAASNEPDTLTTPKGESAAFPPTIHSVADVDGDNVAATTAKAVTLQQQQAKKRLAYGCNSLMYACQSGDIVAVLEQLRSKPERLRQRDSHNKNALHYCAAQSAQKRDLVAAASIAIAAPELLGSADEDGFTPLHLAVIQGNLAMVNLLLANKADVNAVDNEGHSVVHWATVCGEVEALRSVLSAGANVAIPDINGGSPMHYAAQMCGASYDGKLGQGNSTKLALEILGILLAHPHSSVDIQDKDGRQPLLWAASAGSAKAIIALVKAGARVESADKDGLTALHCAASRGHTECIDTLISLCGAPTDLIDSNGCTALHYAVTLGHADATSRLLDLEADPNRQDRKGRTPAHCGCSKGQFETVKLLKERGANLWLRNAKGDLPVHEAASSGRRELVAWLLEQKPKQVNTTSNDGRSLLHIAAANDYTDMCKMLLDCGGDINAVYRNSKGVVNTPLDCALQRGNRSTAKFLQSNGGLPAGKLRLAARRANPFNEATTDIVRPLKYAEKEEIFDLKNSKKYVVYLKRSDSDGGGGGGGGEGSSCSCTEQTYKREQRYAHKCQKHRRSNLRRRTSSEPKDIEKSGNASDICRSKSNIEIRRKKMRERQPSSSECEGNEDDEDSCENCCYHKRQKQRVLQRRRTQSLRRSREVMDTEDDVEEQKIQKRALSEKESSPEKQKPSKTQEAPIEKEILIEPTVEAAASPAAKSPAQSRPQSASKRRTPPPTQAAAAASATKEGTFIKTPPTSAKGKVSDVKKSEDTISTHAVEFTDGEDEQAAKAVTTQVEVHRSAEESKVGAQDMAPAAASTDLKESLTKQASKEIDELLQMAAMAVGSECKNGEALKSETMHEESEKNKDSEVFSNVEATKQQTESQNEKIDETKTVEVETAPVDKPPPPITTTTTATEPSITTQTKTQSQVLNEATSTSNLNNTSDKPQTPASNASDEAKKQREQKSRRSFELLPSDSAEEVEAEEDEGQTIRKSSFQILKSDESIGDLEADGRLHDMDAASDTQVFKIMPQSDGNQQQQQRNIDYDDEDYEEDDEGGGVIYRHGVGSVEIATASASAAAGILGVYESTNGRKRRLKRRVKSGGTKTRSNWKGGKDFRGHGQQQSTKDQDSGFEPSPRASKTKIPAPRNVYTAYTPRRTLYATLDGRSCSSRQEHRKPGDKGACDMTAVTRSIQRNIRRYYMERKIFQHLLELKSLQIRSNKLNEAVLVKRAVDDYHRSCASLGGETGTRLRRYTFTEYSFKNFELFLYETLKALQKPGTYNFQNINEVYEEAERRLSPDYNAYEKALHCTTKTHRCPHAIHAYTGIPCAAYIPMMNHHTMPKFGFGPYKKTSVGSFYLPKILTKSNSYGGCGGGGGGGGAGGNTAVSGSGVGGTTCTGKMALELTHGKSKQLISLPSDKLDSNKRYYVTFTVKETNSSASAAATAGVAGAMTTTTTTTNETTATADKQQQQQKQDNNKELTTK